MKKVKILLVGLCLLLITGCAGSVKDAISSDTFRSVAEKNDLVIADNMESYDADYIKEALLATGDDLSLEMIVYDTEDNAITIQDSHIKAFSNMKSTSEIVKKYKGENYYKYTMISNGYYLVTSRVDNTLIFTKTLLKNKDVVDSILNEIGY